MMLATGAKQRPSSSTGGFADMQLKNTAGQLAGLCVSVTTHPFMRGGGGVERMEVQVPCTYLKGNNRCTLLIKLGLQPGWVWVTSVCYRG